MSFTVILILRIIRLAVLYAYQIVIRGLHADYMCVMGISFHGLFNNIHAAKVYACTGNKIPDRAIAAETSLFFSTDQNSQNEQ